MRRENLTKLGFSQMTKLPGIYFLCPVLTERMYMDTCVCVCVCVLTQNGVLFYRAGIC